jgi:hypothetical protein
MEGGAGSAAPGSRGIGPALNDANLVVEPLDKSQRNFVLRRAKGRNAIPVRFDQADKLLVGFEPLPFQVGFPALEEAPRPALSLVAPELPEGLLEQVG